MGWSVASRPCRTHSVQRGCLRRARSDRVGRTAGVRRPREWKVRSCGMREDALWGRRRRSSLQVGQTGEMGGGDRWQRVVYRCLSSVSLPKATPAVQGSGGVVAAQTIGIPYLVLSSSVIAPSRDPSPSRPNYHILLPRTELKVSSAQKSCFYRAVKLKDTIPYPPGVPNPACRRHRSAEAGPASRRCA